MTGYQTDSRNVRPLIKNMYFFLHAFELVGEHVYGPEWDHEEYNQIRYVDRPEERERLKKIRSEHEAYALEVRALQAKKAGSIDAARNRRWDEEIRNLVQQQGALQTQIDHLSRYETESFLVQVRRTERRDAILSRLFSALADEELLALRLPFQILQRWHWTHPDQMQLMLPLSYAKWPREQSPNRGRSPILIERDLFDAWLQTQAPADISKLVEYPPPVRARHLARELVAKTRHPLKKKTFVTHLTRQVDGLSEAEAIRIWLDPTFIPQEWRKPGPKSRT